MHGLWTLSWRHLAHHRVQSAITITCIALAVFLPVTVHSLIDDYNRQLIARARATPLLAGAKGNRFDLTLSALYFRRSGLDPIPWSELQQLQASGLGQMIPLHARFTARGHTILGTSPEYYELRGLHAARGQLPLRLGDATLGASVARQLALEPGDTLFSDPTDLYDLSKSPALELHVRGVLPVTGTADDLAVFVDVKTCWILEGVAHGHAAPEQIASEMDLGRTAKVVNVSPALRSYQEVTDDNVASFHYHGDGDALPLSAIIAIPNDTKSATLLLARMAASREWQMVVPTTVIHDLMEFVFRIRALFDTFAALLAVTTVLLLGLQIALSMRLRAREMLTLNRIGCSRHVVVGLHAMEVALLVAAGIALAAAGSWLARWILPDLLRAL